VAQARCAASRGARGALVQPRRVRYCARTVMGALRLYLDFINLFMMLMQLLGTRRD
jgi:hypothetical protein